MANTIEDDESIGSLACYDNELGPDERSNGSTGYQVLDTKLSPEKKRSIKRFQSNLVVVDFMVQYPKYSLLLYLFLASKSVGHVAGIPEVLHLTFQRMEAFSKFESDAYYECTLDSFVRLEQELHQTANREKETVAQLHAANGKILKWIENVTSACALDTRKAQQGLFHWNSRLAQPLPLLDASGCTETDHAWISASLGEDLQELEDEVSSILNDYRSHSEKSFRLLRKYARDRSDYDYNFFLEQRIKPALMLLQDLGNSTFYSIHFSVDPFTTASKLVSMAEGLADALEVAMERIDLLTKQVSNFYDNIRLWKERYTKLFDRAHKMINIVNPWLLDTDLLPKVDADVFKINPDFDILSITADQILPKHFKLVEFNPDTSILPTIDSLVASFEEEATALVTELVKTLSKQAKENVQAIESVTFEALDEIRTLLTLNDYDPPQYQGSRPELKTVDNEFFFLSQMGDAAEANAKRVVNGFRSFQVSSSKELPPTVPEIDTAVDPFDSNTTTFEHQEINLPPILQFLRTSFVLIVACLFGTSVRFADMIWQLYRFWRLKKKHEKNAKPELPQVSFETAQSEEAGGETGERWLGNLTTFSWIVLQQLFNVFAPIFLCALGVFLLRVFVIYPHYEESCVLSNDGSSFANTILIPHFINQANVRGNDLHIKSQNECYNQQRLLCDQNAAKSELVYRNDLATLSHLQQSQDQTQSVFKRLERCVDTNRLDKALVDACCGLEGYETNCKLVPNARTHRCPIDGSPATAFLPIGHYLSGPHCHVNASFWALKDSRFSCQVLSKSCNTSCSGVDEGLLRSLIVEADCVLWFTIIGNVDFFFLAAFHALMINILFPLLFKGCRNYMWESANPFGVLLVTRIDRKGRVLKGSSREQLAKKAEDAINKFERTSLMSLLMGFAVAATWVTCFLAFKPSARKS